MPVIASATLLVLSLTCAFQLTASYGSGGHVSLASRRRLRVSSSFSEMDPTVEDLEFTPAEPFLLEPRYSMADWVTHIVTFPQSYVLRRVFSHLAFNVAWSVVVVAIFWSYPEARGAAESEVFMPFSLSGGIIGIGLAFKTSQSYDRFWQGREVWAKVTNRARALARQSAVYAVIVPEDDQVEVPPTTIPASSSNDSPMTSSFSLFRGGAMATSSREKKKYRRREKFDATKREEVHEEVVRWTVAFCVALKQHLRGERDLSEFECLEEVERARLATAKHVPLACCYALSTAIDPYRTAGSDDQGSTLLWWQMEALVTDLQDTIGATEAVAGTPMPLVYTRHTSRLLSVWTLSSPLVLAATNFPLFLVPLATLVVSWMLLATEEIGHLIEEPFGTHLPDSQMPLDRYCDTIKKDLYEMNALRSRAFYRTAGSAPPPKGRP